MEDRMNHINVPRLHGGYTDTTRLRHSCSRLDKSRGNTGECDVPRDVKAINIRRNERLWQQIEDPALRRMMRLLVKYADPRTGRVSAKNMELVEREFCSEVENG